MKRDSHSQPQRCNHTNTHTNTLAQSVSTSKSFFGFPFDVLMSLSCRRSLYPVFFANQHQHFRVIFNFFKKMGQPRALFHLFLSFQTNIMIFRTIVKKCLSRILCQDSNSRPLEHESSPITTRPGLPPVKFNFIFCTPQIREVLAPFFFSLLVRGCLFFCLHHSCSLSFDLFWTKKPFIRPSLCFEPGAAQMKEALK